MFAFCHFFSKNLDLAWRRGNATTVSWQTGFGCRWDSVWTHTNHQVGWPSSDLRWCPLRTSLVCVQYAMNTNQCNKPLLLSKFSVFVRPTQTRCGERLMQSVSNNYCTLELSRGDIFLSAVWTNWPSLQEST